MRAKWLVLFLVASAALMWACASQPQYESAAGDPIDARIYTLDNGLKVYMSVNRDEPRIQANIAVRVGSKNDPAETTGLSHYLEHIMFKGTPSFGTMNYEAERPYLDQIEQLYERYRKLTDSAERAAAYREIDSISYIASGYAIPNEYDKLMSAIGSQGTNAYTSFDQTVYVEDIPSNQLETWAMVQADRFQNMVIRGFHTELEAVYEEKNISMDRDGSRMFDSLMTALFPSHPYGQQTTIGTQEHLKNPSITNIKKHYETYYVPNNMAICLAGDFDPDQALAVIKKYFGGMQPNRTLPVSVAEPLSPLPQVREASTYGMQQEQLYIGWRVPAPTHPEYPVMQVLSSLLYNGTAGLIDQEVVSKIRALAAFAWTLELADHSALVLGGYPLEGQSLEALRDVLLEQVDRVRRGDFDEALLTSVYNNARYHAMRSIESNENRADYMVDAFVTQRPWAQVASLLEDMRQVTKQQVVDYANKYLPAHAYAVSYKRMGENTSRQEIAKPEITPIQMNRDTVSAFVKRVQEMEPAPIEPQFVDFAKSLTRFEIRPGVEVLLSKNETNGLFKLDFVFEFGSTHSKTISMAATYADFADSEGMSLSEFQREIFGLGGGYSVSAGSEQTQVSVWGLNENIERTVALVIRRLRTLKVDEAKYRDVVAGVLKERADMKRNQNAIFSRLRSYVAVGEHNQLNSVLSNAEIQALNPSVLVEEIRGLLDLPHALIYYAPVDRAEAERVLGAVHAEVAPLRELPQPLYNFATREPKEVEVYLADYSSAQVLASHYASDGRAYDLSLVPQVNLFNSYFGGSMNAIVFQEIREARALAYSSSAHYATPTRLDRKFSMSTYIGTQLDKLGDAIAAFNEILVNMPTSANSFNVAKESLIAEMRTTRYSNRQIPDYFLRLRRLGLSEDPQPKFYEAMQHMTMEQLVAFQNECVKNLTYNYAVLGDTKKMDLEVLRKLGTVKEVTLEQVFGY